MSLVKTFLSLPAVVLPLYAATTQTVADRADAVVVAEIASGQQSAAYATFSLLVTRTIKGNIAPGAMISVEWKNAATVPSATTLSGEFGMWFLAAGTPSLWELLPYSSAGRARPLELAHYPLPTGPAPPEATPGISASEMMAAELATGVAQFSASPLNGQLSDMGQAIWSVPDSPTMTTIYQRLAGSSNRDARTLGLAGLIRTGDVNALSQAPRTTGDTAKLYFGVQYATALRGFRNSKGVDTLGMFATSLDSSPGVQALATDALRAIHTAGTLPYLATLLDSADPGLQSKAIAGFSAFVENLPTDTPDRDVDMTWMTPQGPAPFRTGSVEPYLTITGKPKAPTSQSDCASFWKTWWQANQSQLLGK